MSQSIKSMGGEGLDYKILDNVTAVGFGGGGGGSWDPTLKGTQLMRMMKEMKVVVLEVKEIMSLLK